MQTSWHRLFAYMTLAPMLGAFFYIATHSFYIYAESGGISTFIFISILMFIIGNITYGLALRFIKKSSNWTFSAYLLGLIFILPSIIQIAISADEVGVYDAQPVLFSTMIFASFLGSYFGIKIGMKRHSVRSEK